MARVRLSDGSVVEFDPDTATAEDFDALIAQNKNLQQPEVSKVLPQQPDTQKFSGSLAGVLGLPVDLVNSALQKVGIPTSGRPFLGSEFIQKQVIEPSGKAEEAIKENLPRIAKEAALPTAGEVIGGFGAGAAAFALTGSPRMTARAALVGETVGGGIGEALNQFFGITPKSKAQIALAAAGPIVSRGIIGVGKGIARRLPGAGAGLQEKAIEDIAGIGLGIKPGGVTPSSVLFDEIKDVNPFIPTGKTLSAVEGLLEQELSKSTPNSSLVNKLTSLRDKIQTGGRIDPSTLIQTGKQGLDFSDLRADLSEFGGLGGEALRKGNTKAAGKFNRVVSSLQEDLEIAARAIPGQAGSTLKLANKAFTLEKFQENFLNLLDDPSLFPPPRQVDGLLSVNSLSLIKRLKKGKEFAIPRRVLKDQFDDIIKTLEAIRISTRPLPPVGGASFGSGVFARRAAFGSAAGVATGRTAESAGIGAIMLPVISEFVSQALISTPGRKFIKLVVKGGKPLTVQTIAAGLQAIRNIPSLRSVVDLMADIIQKQTEKDIDIQKLIEPAQPFRKSREPVFRQEPPRRRTLQEVAGQ
ncbi:MAG: hypothetical protein IIB56_09680 [Planctomycetes bacterium]|nr:hypothetical protein [Planctomycetota bacterium]